MFIDARKLGTMTDRRHRQLTDQDIKKISDTYHAWRGECINGQQVEYRDIAGFCKAVKFEEVRKQGHILTPGRYVGTEEEEDNEGTFEELMEQLTADLSIQIKKGLELDAEIKKAMKSLGYDL